MAELDLGKVVPEIDYSKAMKAPGSEVCPALDDCKENGYYQTNRTTGGQFPRNIPEEQKEGILRVLAHITNKSVLQEWYSIGNEEDQYVRVFVKDHWSDWEKTLTKKYGMVSTYGATPTSIPINDANEFKTDGVAMTSRLTKNLPEEITHTEGTIMFIRNNHDLGVITGTQVYYPSEANYSGRVYVRTVASSQVGRGNWKEVGAINTKKTYSADGHRTNGYVRTDATTSGLPPEVNSDTPSKVGMLLYVSDDQPGPDRGTQMYYCLGGQHKGNIYIRTINDQIWQPKWRRIITANELFDNCYLKKDWETMDTQAHQDINVHESGYVVYPAEIGGRHKVVMEWFKVDVPRGGVEIRTKKITRVYSAQVTQYVPGDQRPPSDHFDQFYVRVPDDVPGNLWVYSSDARTSHAYVTVIGIV